MNKASPLSNQALAEPPTDVDVQFERSFSQALDQSTRSFTGQALRVRGYAYNLAVIESNSYQTFSL